MTPEGDRVGVEGIASAGLRPLGDHEEPLVRAERRPVDGIEVVVDRDRRRLGGDVVVRRSVPHDEQKLIRSGFRARSSGR